MSILKKVIFVILPLLIISIFLNLFLKLSKISVIKKEKKEKYDVKIEKSEEDTYSYPGYAVIIDPQNGGEDKGSISDNGIAESDLNLRFAFLLAREIRTLGVRAYMSRTKDTNLSLEERFKAIKDSTLYISISSTYGYKTDVLDVFAFSNEESFKNLEEMENRFFDFYEGIYEEKTSEVKDLENKIYGNLYKEFDLKNKYLRRAFLKNLSYSKDLASIHIIIADLKTEDLQIEKNMNSYASRLAKAIVKGLD